MKAFSPARRRFLFLQGPPGPFFWLLAQELKQRGHPVFRINFNGGDRADWPGEATNYDGGTGGWNRSPRTAWPSCATSISMCSRKAISARTG